MNTFTAVSVLGLVVACKVNARCLLVGNDSSTPLPHHLVLVYTNTR
jgi:hypothetical protein